MKLDRKFTEQELNLIAILLSRKGAELTNDDGTLVKGVTKEQWKKHWELQEYFRCASYEVIS